MADFLTILCVTFTVLALAGEFSVYELQKIAATDAGSLPEEARTPDFFKKAGRTKLVYEVLATGFFVAGLFIR